jgi:hypothetical protein
LPSLRTGHLDGELGIAPDDDPEDVRDPDHVLLALPGLVLGRRWRAASGAAEPPREHEESEEARQAPSSIASIQIHRDPLVRNGTNDRH